MIARIKYFPKLLFSKLILPFAAVDSFSTSSLFINSTSTYFLASVALCYCFFVHSNTLSGNLLVIL